MNPIQKFYQNTLLFLESSGDGLFLSQLKKETRRARCEGVSWDMTDAKLGQLREAVRGSLRSIAVAEEFVRAAFRDLSPLSNPQAHDLFDRLSEICGITYPAHLLWARKIEPYYEGSKGGYMILHMSDIAAAKRLVAETTGRGNCLSARIIY